MKKFAIHTYTTQVIVEEGDLFEPSIPNDAMYGMASGTILSESVEVTDDLKRVAELTQEQGSDPKFFGLYFDEESGQWSVGDIED